MNKYFQDEITPEEKHELFRLIESQGARMMIDDRVEYLLNSLDDSVDDSTVDYESIYQNVLENVNLSEGNRYSFKKVGFKLLVAASLAFLVGLWFYFSMESSQHNEQEISAIRENDIAPPATVHAVLTLSDGQKILLDSLGEDVLIKQGQVKMVRLNNGSLTYHGTGDQLEYNTMTNPKGSKVVRITLSDGTKVWLNSDSQLKYPTSFVESKRKVEVEGEAYFEVAHNESKPFIVTRGNTSITVLGTSFNVNGYEENSTDVTLLQGSISLSSTNKHAPVLVKPGQQVSVTASGTIERNKEVDLDLVMAWKNGNFLFKGARLENIMREVSRWYNVEIIFEKPVEEKFYAEVPRNTSVTALLKMMEATKAVQFRIKGQKIIVTSPKYN